MTVKFPNLARQFFDSVLKAKGVDQPTIDFIWEHGECLYLWQQNFGMLTKAQLQQLAEVAAEVHVSPKNMPPLQMVSDTQGYLRFDSFTFQRGVVQFFYEGKLTYTMHTGRESGVKWYPEMMTQVNGLDGKVLFHTTAP